MHWIPRSVQKRLVHTVEIDRYRVLTKSRRFFSFYDSICVIFDRFLKHTVSVEAKWPRAIPWSGPFCCGRYSKCTTPTPHLRRIHSSHSVTSKPMYSDQQKHERRPSSLHVRRGKGHIPGDPSECHAALPQPLDSAIVHGWQKPKGTELRRTDFAHLSNLKELYLTPIAISSIEDGALAPLTSLRPAGVQRRLKQSPESARNITELRRTDFAHLAKLMKLRRMGFRP